MRRRARPVAWGLTLALHVLVALLLAWQTASRKPAPAVKRVNVRLLAMPAPAQNSTPPRPISPPTRPRLPASRNASPAAPRQDVATTPSIAAPAPLDESHAITAPAGNSPALPPLSLTLPASAAASGPRSMVNAALNDPRSNSRRLTPSERFAASLGTNTDRVEERIVDGVRIRQGNSCVLVHESKGSFIDPFNQSNRPMPKMAEKCP